MKQFTWWQKIGIVILFVVLPLGYVGLRMIPEFFWLPNLIMLGGYGVYHGFKHGFKFWKSKKKFETKYAKAMTQEQTERKIAEYFDREDIIIDKTKSEKEGVFTTVKIVGKKDTPVLLSRRYISRSKAKPCWAAIACDMTTGNMLVRNLENPEFTIDHLKLEIEEMVGKKEYVERISLPEQRGPVIEKIYLKPTEGEQ